MATLQEQGKDATSKPIAFQEEEEDEEEGVAEISSDQNNEGDKIDNSGGDHHDFLGRMRYLNIDLGKVNLGDEPDDDEDEEAICDEMNIITSAFMQKYLKVL